MKLTSQTIAPSASLKCSGERARASRLSSERTRGSAASSRVELAPPDVDGDHGLRASLEQDVGESAGRGADVETDEPARIERKGVEGGGEFHAAPRSVGVRRVGFDRGAVGDPVRRLAQRLAADTDEPGGDRRLRPRPAHKEAALDENDVRALAHEDLQRRLGTSGA